MLIDAHQSHPPPPTHSLHPSLLPARVYSVCVRRPVARGSGGHLRVLDRGRAYLCHLPVLRRKPPRPQRQVPPTPRHPIFIHTLPFLSDPHRHSSASPSPPWISCVCACVGVRIRAGEAYLRRRFETMAASPAISRFSSGRLGGLLSRTVRHHDVPVAALTPTCDCCFVPPRLCAGNKVVVVAATQRPRQRAGALRRRPRRCC
jgi:hypothetical protein